MWRSHQVVKACEQHDIALAVLGDFLNVHEKSRITSTVRNASKRGTPIVALYQKSASEADDADTALAAEDGPETLVKTVQKLLRSGRKKSPKGKKALGKAR